MNKKIQKNQNNSNVSVFEKVVDSISRNHKDSAAIEKRGMDILTKLTNAKDDTEKKILFQQLCREAIRYRSAKSLDTNTLFVRSVDSEFIDMAVAMIESLKQIYNISTNLGKAQVQIAVLAFCRYQSNMAKFELIKASEACSNESLSYMKILSKDSDRAFRQWESAIRQLEFGVRPPINLNVKAKNVFMAQNQQNIPNHNQGENNE
jgi:hypothetical protein